MEIKNTKAKAAKKSSSRVGNTNKTGAKVAKKTKCRVKRIIITAGVVIGLGLLTMGLFVNHIIKDNKVANSLVHDSMPEYGNYLVLTGGFSSSNYDSKLCSGKAFMNAAKNNNMKIIEIDGNYYTDGGYDIVIFPIQFTVRKKSTPANINFDGSNYIFAKNGDILKDNGECYSETVVNCMYAAKDIEGVNDYTSLISFNEVEGYEFLDFKIIGSIEKKDTKDFKSLCYEDIILDVIDEVDLPSSDSTNNYYPAKLSLGKR